MRRTVEVENRLFTFITVLFLSGLYMLQLGTLFLGSSGKVSFFHLGGLTLPSAGLFITVCILASWRRRLYFLFLVFVMLAFPAPVDDLFPSIPLTSMQDKTQVLFPLFTRIDIYLLLGIFLRLVQKDFQFPVLQLSLWIKLIVLVYLLVFLINALSAADMWDFNLLLAYSFHIRYLLLVIILLQLYDIRIYQKVVVTGIVLSMIFLLLEAGINTHVKGSDRLLSGSLSLNTFANISAAVALYIIFLLRRQGIGKWTGFLTLLVVGVILIGSQTRGAILTLVISFILLNLIVSYRRMIINFLKVLLGVGFLVFSYILASKYNYIPERYSYEKLYQRIEIDLGESSLGEIFNIKKSPETNSIKSRLDLFDSSINMIQEYPLTGIGAGRWNRYKNVYSQKQNIPNVLLDSHNDYLALWSQYGIILGSLLAWWVFFQPFRQVKKGISTMNSAQHPLLFLYVVNFAMGIAALSNSGFFKHQIAAFLIFGACVVSKISRSSYEGT